MHALHDEELTVKQAAVLLTLTILLGNSSVIVALCNKREQR